MDKAEFYELFFDEVFRLDVIKETDDEIHFDSLANSFEIVWDKKDFIKVFFNDSSLEMKIPFDIVERLWYFYEYDLSSRDVYDLDHIINLFQYSKYNKCFNVYQENERFYKMYSAFRGYFEDENYIKEYLVEVRPNNKFRVYIGDKCRLYTEITN